MAGGKGMTDQTVTITATAQPVEVLSVNKTYSLTMRHILAVSKMAEEASERTGRVVSQGEIIRTAIELLQDEFDAVFGLMTITAEGLAALSKSETPSLPPPSKEQMGEGLESV
jgi:hypothetical protein